MHVAHARALAAAVVALSTCAGATRLGRLDDEPPTRLAAGDPAPPAPPVRPGPAADLVLRAAQ